MRIAIDIRSLQDGEKTGVGEYTAELVRALVAEHPEHEYILFSNSFSSKIEWDKLGIQESPVKQVHTRYPNKLFTLLTSLGLVKLDELIKKRINNSLDLFFSPCLQTGFVSNQTPWVVTIHDLSFELYPECLTLKRKLWHALVQPKKQARAAQHIITPSKSASRDVRSYYSLSANQVTAIYPGLKPLTIAHIQQVQSAYQLPNNYFLSLGTIEPRKNLAQVIRAYETTKLSEQGVQLLIAGAKGWKNRTIHRLIKKTSGVRYLGYIPAEHKGRLMKQAKAFVYPSVYEGFGFPVLEALSVGTPVITSNRSSLPEVAGRQALYVDPDTCTEIARAMKELIYHPQCLKKHQPTFRWEHTANQVEALFSSLTTTI